MDVLAVLRSANGRQLANQRQDRVTDNVGLISKTVEIESFGVFGTGFGDRLASPSWDDAYCGLGTGKRRFNVYAAGDVGFIAEDLKRYVSFIEIFLSPKPKPSFNSS